MLVRWLPVAFLVCALPSGQGRVGRESSLDENHLLRNLVHGIQNDIALLKAENREMKQLVSAQVLEIHSLKNENRELQFQIQNIRQANVPSTHHVELPTDPKIMISRRSLLQEAKSTNFVSVSQFNKYKKDTDKRVGSLERKWNALQLQQNVTNQTVESVSGRLNTLKSQLACVDHQSNGTDLFFEGCNVHIRNGMSSTESVNSVGNLIIGYNEDENYALSSGKRNGSHNVIIGPQHQYVSYGSIISGQANSVSGAYASCIGGLGNDVSGNHSVAVAGSSNILTGLKSAAIAGFINKVEAIGSAAIAGRYNDVHGKDAASVGGEYNMVETDDMSYYDNANLGAVAVGGLGNSIEGRDSVSVAGGSNHLGKSFGGTAVGGSDNLISGPNAAALGGSKNEITDLSKDGVAIGGTNNLVEGKSAVAVGGKTNVLNPGAAQGVTVGGTGNTLGGDDMLDDLVNSQGFGHESVIVGGIDNINHGVGSVVVGGQSNSLVEGPNDDAFPLAAVQIGGFANARDGTFDFDVGISNSTFVADGP